MTTELAPLTPNPRDPATRSTRARARENGEAVSETKQKVAIVTGGSQGIGAGVVDGYRQRGWAVVANSRDIKPSKDPDVLMVGGDVSEQATAEQIINQALDRFGRVDTLVNNAGVFVSKPFTEYTAEDYVLVTGVNLAGFCWLTQGAIGQLLKQHSGHVVNISGSVADRAEPTALAARTKGGLAADEHLTVGRDL
jgi:NAD(P)-dependent dehydrogenase (short-subunit alcohol dehydrogenase family)